MLLEGLPEAQQSAQLLAMRARGLRSEQCRRHRRTRTPKRRSTTPSNITRRLTPSRSGRQSMNNFRRAFAACLESKGYTVK